MMARRAGRSGGVGHVVAIGLLVAPIAAIFACSAASTATVANVAGTYSLSVVDGSNMCMLQGLSEGVATSGTSLQILQDSQTPQNMTATLGGPAGAALTAAVGTNILTGTLGGLQATLAPGTVDGGAAPTPPMLSSGSCSFTVNAALSLSFAGDTVQGTLVYTLNATGSCGALATCQSVQALAGVLTPSDS